MQLHFTPYTLELRHTFTLTGLSRTTTPVMLVEIEQDGIVGFGEASMPPYLGENHETATAFLSRVKLNGDLTLDSLDGTLRDLDAIAPDNHAAKAAVDIALHDWLGKRLHRAWYEIWGLDPSAAPPTSFTIGIDRRDVIREKVKEANAFRILKVKLGSDHDREIIETIRELTDRPLRVDVNQGWRDCNAALKVIEWLAGKNVELVEQPFPSGMLDEQAWLKERSPLPIIADEAVARMKDLPGAAGLYHGVNIKLMKCTGMHEAYTMANTAHHLGLKVMLGCMTETSCAILAAAQLSPLVDYADLDGAFLIRNDPFSGTAVVDGRVVIPKGPGIGVTLRVQQ
jgi:L-alanine-DL-glutamate epimerase-like enolase superfamily enzyme